MTFIEPAENFDAIALGWGMTDVSNRMIRAILNQKRL
jgi:hypothetical protein